MARIFITGSSDGLGRMAAQLLLEQGHQAVLHARNERRGREAMAALPEAETVVTGDLSSISQTRSVAEQVPLALAARAGRELGGDLAEAAFAGASQAA